jgi:hypothetical protein
MIVGTSVRPGRSAVFVDIEDPYWHRSCLSVVHQLTREWGGCGSIIVPTDGTKILPIFWKILDRFDPDYLRYFRRTGRDVECDEPEKFEAAYQIHLRTWKRDTGADASEDQAEKIRQSMRKSITSDFAVSPELQQELKSRLSPFYFEKFAVEAGALNAGDSPVYPFTDVVDLLPEIEHPSRVLRISDTHGIMPPLWWASEVGCADERFIESLEQAGIQALTVGEDSAQSRALISLVMTRRERIRSKGYWNTSFPATISEILEAFPENISMIGLGYFQESLAWADDWKEPVVAIAGNDLRDFALYHSLSRMRNRVVWISPSLTDQALGRSGPEPEQDERSAFGYALEHLAQGDSQRQPGLSLISATLPFEELKKVQEHLEQRGFLDRVPCSIDDPELRVPFTPIRHCESNNADRMRTITLSDDHEIPMFETPMPRNFKTVRPDKHRWLTELRFIDHQLPRHYALGRATMGASFFSTKEIRISSVGPTYFCPSVMIFGGATAESSLPRPNISLPGPLRLFQIIAQSAELSCSISDKGVYAQDATEKFGEIGKIAEFLRSKHGQAFSTAYRDKTKSIPGEYTKGCMLAGRRYHDLRSLSAAMNDPAAAESLLDRLSLLGILHRGYALKCGICRYADWHPFRDLTDSFTCRRCRSEQIFTKKNWLDPEQPQVYYQLDELTYLGLEHDMQVPLLTLDRLRRTVRRSFLFTHELEYRSPDSTERPIEADINCVIDGDLAIGEAKSEDHLGKSEKEENELISRYVELGKKLCAHSLVFATAKEAWRQATLGRIRKLVGTDRFEIKLMTRADLYS